MLRRPAIMLLAGLALCLPLAAHSQINPFRSSSRAGLRASDFRAIDEAARRLAAHPDVRDGTAESWNNPETGASGTITVASTFRRHGMLCHGVNYTAQTAASQTPRSKMVNWCKTSQGWKMI